MTDTTTLEGTNSGTPQQVPTLRQSIRESWVNYVGNATYDVTRAAVDFLLEGVLKELSVYGKSTTLENNTALDQFKGLVLSFTNAVRPRTLAISDAIGSAVGYLAKKIIGNIIGQFTSTSKAEAYELDHKNRGPINLATTQFARDNIKWMILGSLGFAVGFPSTYKLGTLANLVSGLGLGFIAKKVLPPVYQTIMSVLPSKKAEPKKQDEQPKSTGTQTLQTGEESGFNPDNQPSIGDRPTGFTPSYTGGSQNTNEATSASKIPTPENSADSDTEDFEGDNLTSESTVRKRKSNK